MDHLHLPLALFDHTARIAKALASPHRLRLLALLAQAERTVERLAEQAHLSVANTSQHLQVLRAAHLVDAHRDGLHVTYRIADPAVTSFLAALRTLAESRLAEIDQLVRRFLTAKDDMEPVDRATLWRWARAGEVLVLDVRPPEEYRAGHLPGALSIPLRELRNRLSELPGDRQIVAYCRGPYCFLAVEAVELLRTHSFRAARLEEGVLEWQAAGLPLEHDGSELAKDPLALSAGADPELVEGEAQESKGPSTSRTPLRSVRFAQGER